MNSYEAIFCRKSVRKFSKDIITPDKIRYIIKAQNQVEALYPGLKVEWQIIDLSNGTGTVKGVFKVKAPYFMVLHSASTERARVNAGYMMEQMVLYLTTKGLGSCYQGMVNVPELPGSGLVPHVVIAFGYPAEKLLRPRKDFKRIPPERVVMGSERLEGNMRKIVEAATLAPSAFNRQPWRFLITGKKIHLFFRNSRMGISGNRYTFLLDMGIAISHMMLECEEQWIRQEFIRIEELTAKKPKNYTYILTMEIDESR